MFQVKIVPLENDLGKTQFTKGIITIDEEIPQSQKESTLIHEIFHCLNTTMDASTLGHAMLDSLSEQFYQVLKDNHLLR